MGHVLCLGWSLTGSSLKSKMRIRVSDWSLGPQHPAKVMFSFCWGQLLYFGRHSPNQMIYKFCPLEEIVFPFVTSLACFPTSQTGGVKRALQNASALAPQPFLPLRVTDESTVLCGPILESESRLRCHNYLWTTGAVLLQEPFCRNALCHSSECNMATGVDEKHYMGVCLLLFPPYQHPATGV